MIKDIKKSFKKINTNIKYLNKSIKEVLRDTDKSYLSILFDIVFSHIIFGATINEYKAFKFYLLDYKEKGTYLTKTRHNRMKKYLESSKILNVLNNKELFNLRFKSYLNREIYNINKMSFKEFEEFAIKSKKTICRSNSSSYVKSYNILDVVDFRSPAFMADKIKKDSLSLVEKIIFSNKVLKSIKTDFIIINVVTVFNNNTADILASTIKFKDNNKIVSGFIDVKKGVIKGNLIYDNCETFMENTDGLEIPYFKNIIDMSKKMSKELEEIRQVEWSFTFDNKGNIYLLDGNTWSDFTFVQMPCYTKYGIMPYYKNNISKWRGF